MAQVSNRAEYLRKALSNFNMRSVAGKHLGEVTVHHPGITYSDLSTNSRYPTVWNLQRIVEGIRFFAHHMKADNSQQTFLEYDELTSDRFTFMASTEFHIAPCMYDYMIPKVPLEAEIKLNHIGTSSLSTVCDLIIPTTRDLLLRNTNGVISVDKETRKPLALPSYWLEKYKPHTATDQPFRIVRQAHPENSRKDNAVVRWSDTDFYQHTNWSSYVKYSLDAALLIAHQGSFEKTHISTIQNNAVKFATVSYNGESKLGDLLDVYAWESDENQLDFDIIKENKPICYCRVQYYTEDELAKPNLF